MLLGMTADDVERIGHAALLHDVGKLGIPPEILRKDGTLNDAEWDLMVEHPVIGEGILRRIPSSRRSRRSFATSTSTGTAPATPTASSRRAKQRGVRGRRHGGDPQVRAQRRRRRRA